MLGSLQSPIAVVAHDAGAANHIIAWLKNSDRSLVHACLRGPAAELWRQAFSRIPGGEFSDTIVKSRTLISGTGWASNLEHDSRRIARQLGIISIAVIDHWTNYRERFVRDGEEILPDEIWVTDEYAKTRAESEMPNLKITQLPNMYLENLVQQVRWHERIRVDRAGNNLLYVLEPIRQTWGASTIAGEFMGLEYFVKNIGLLRLGSDPSIRLRPHPSDPAGKYDQWIKRQNNSRITIDPSLTLWEAIAWSDVVVGLQSYAMVVALAAGRRVISSIPCWAPPCVLPQPGIIKLSDLLRRQEMLPPMSEART